jgi:two-component system LytT family sensor kinase
MMLRSRISGIKMKIILHGLVWVVLLFLQVYLIYGDTDREKAFLTEVWFQIVFYGIVFYISYLWLAPRYFFTGRKAAFFAGTAIIILAMAVILGLVNNYHEPVFRKEMPPGFAHRPGAAGLPPPPAMDVRHPPKPKPGPIKYWPVFNFLLTASLISGLSLGIRLSEKLAFNEKLRKEAEKEKLNTELALLKHQINPHFLFNTLNSIYSLALMKSDMTAEAVMKLSEMMRYVLQDVTREKVPLELEIEYVVHLVELQKMRLSDNVEVKLLLEGDPKPYEIPPIILVPFVENAFKYGTSAHEQAVISIELKISGAILRLQVSNQVFRGRENTGTFGIGIRNTRQRLALMYPGRHALQVDDSGNQFMVNLMINLV